jgi:LTXXQ motif family protein
MKQTIRLAALGAALVLGVSTVAAAQPPAGRARSGAVAGDTTHARRHARGARRGERGRALARDLFRGVQLSDAQRTQVQAIHKKYAEQRRTLVQQLRAETKDGQRVRPDSASRARVRSLMEQEMTELRGVLTADQQRTFDQNVAAFRDRAKAHRGKRAAE